MPRRFAFDFAKRQAYARDLMRQERLDALVLAGFDGVDPNVYYYSGEDNFPALLLFGKDGRSTLWTAQPEREYPVDSVVEFKGGREDLVKAIKAMPGSKRAKRVGFDTKSDASAWAFRMQDKFKVVPVARQLLLKRELKDARELACIQQAQTLTKKAVQAVIHSGLRNRTENAIAGRVELFARESGAALNAFTPIVLSGPNTAVIHGHPGARKVANRDVVLFDVGAKVQFYCADHSHTELVGGAGRGKNRSLFADAVEAVRESTFSGVRLARRAKTGKEVSEHCLAVLNEYGFVKNTFKDVGLAVGHHVGLAVHDGATGLEHATLAKGMAFTVEPGLYFPGKFGVRFEEIVVR